MFFDTHAHMDDAAFDSDRDEVIATFPSQGVSLVLNPGSDLASSRRAKVLSEKWSFLYAAVGIHPHAASSVTAEVLDEIRVLTQGEKVQAIGEIGLDYHYDFSPRDMQKQVFRAQMELARELKMPVIIHEREACQDTMEILRDYKDVQGVVHCYSGSWETAKELLDMGWYLSFTGVVTFKNARKPVEVSTKMPIDRLMLETDCPYMAPVPLRGTRNDPRNIRHTAEFIARCRDIPVEELARVTMENGKQFFHIHS